MYDPRSGNDTTVVVLLERVEDSSQLFPSSLMAWSSFCREFLLPNENLALADLLAVRDLLREHFSSQLSGFAVTLMALVVDLVELLLTKDDVWCLLLPLPLPPPLMEQQRSSLMPLRKFLDMKAYNKGLTPELKYVTRNVRGVNREEKVLPPT